MDIGLIYRVTHNPCQNTNLFHGSNGVYSYKQVQYDFKLGAKHAWPCIPCPFWHWHHLVKVVFWNHTEPPSGCLWHSSSKQDNLICFNTDLHSLNKAIDTKNTLTDTYINVIFPLVMWQFSWAQVQVTCHPNIFIFNFQNAQSQLTSEQIHPTAIHSHKKVFIDWGSRILDGSSKRFIKNIFSWSLCTAQS